MKHAKIFIFIAILLSLLATLFIKIKPDRKSTESSRTSPAPAESSSLPEMLASLNILSPAETKKAPEFELTSIEGEKVSLGKYRGKVVMLSFWATW
jgi:cytochrome oxidase Cu insertion factor (SCO1/SenC/PrrC family)